MSTWRRSSSNRKVAGVCGGLSDMLGIDATVLRFTVALSSCFIFPIILAYIIAWVVVPITEEVSSVDNSYGSNPHATANNKTFITEDDPTR